MLGVHGELRKFDRSPENADKDVHYAGSRSFKVIEFGTNRTVMYDFVSVTYSTLATSRTLSE